MVLFVYIFLYITLNISIAKENYKSNYFPCMVIWGSNIFVKFSKMFRKPRGKMTDYVKEQSLVIFKRFTCKSLSILVKLEYSVILMAWISYLLKNGVITVVTLLLVSSIQGLVIFKDHGNGPTFWSTLMWCTQKNSKTKDMIPIHHILNSCFDIEYEFEILEMLSFCEYMLVNTKLTGSSILAAGLLVVVGDLLVLFSSRYM